ncbi:protein transport protein Sec24C, putative [Trypanosoma brucei brucei TREU927]|uniref:Protein transport protein Sec24C, putative n=1 Tax=Trypanosoma brucei brucei (strain 927/4 GUTat10.1) TaxID=185431 RepID=Q57XV4_TRYB2|nr:protein transport protein Sec24C, putative [Trypanosoma brucei brucei TREU927]AAX69564.1 protein transport protein Sec24C, putative [Trypanosoma brucei]AAZ10156.1 protein transport protein Sec24C, putative [Trypanosoma brucei brucei TREU927]
MSYPHNFDHQAPPLQQLQQQVPPPLPHGSWAPQPNQGPGVPFNGVGPGITGAYGAASASGNAPTAQDWYYNQCPTSASGAPYSNGTNNFAYTPEMQYQPPHAQQQQQQQQLSYKIPSAAAAQPSFPGLGATAASSPHTPATVGQYSEHPPAARHHDVSERNEHRGIPCQENLRSFPAPQSRHSADSERQSTGPPPNYVRPPPRRAVDLVKAPNPNECVPPSSDSLMSNHSNLQFPSGADANISNASVKFFRPTMKWVPASANLVKDSRVPFGAVIAPLCQPVDPQEEVPCVSGYPPVRCQRCRAYVSCHARFTNMGRNWVCPLCSMCNDVSEEYFCNLDNQGQRLDKMQRPELSRGSVEFDVDAYPEYALRNSDDAALEARPLHYLFLLDVSVKAATTFLSDYVDALLRSLHEMAVQYPECRVAFITYASTLHFYNVRHPRMPQMIVSDVCNPFVPLPFTSLCWLTLGTELDLVDAFLLRVPEYASDLCETGCVLGAAVEVAKLVLSGQHGGRVIITAHKAPQNGIGAIKPREQHVLYGTEKEKELLRPLDGYWQTIATTCAKEQISLDLHMFADEYCELVTLSHPCHVTNGRVHLFSNYDSQTDAVELQAVLDQALLEEAGYAGILRVRCSTGLRVQRYHGHFFSQDKHDMDLVHVQGSSSFYVEFAHESKPDSSSAAYFQTALLYTTRRGNRRVRVHSVRIPIASSISSIFDGDTVAVLMAYIHQVISNSVNKGLKYAREQMHQQLLQLLTSYRRVVSQKSTSVLLMPGSLRLMPLYTLCVLKSDAIAEGTTVRIDDRVQKLFHLLTVPTHQCLSYFYPTLYAMHSSMEETFCGAINPETGDCVMPPRKRLFYESITTDGVYILCDEQARSVYLWVGSAVTPEISLELFGTANSAEVGRSVFFDHFGERLRNVLWACLNRDGRMRRLVILHQKDRGEEAFFKQLKEEGEGGTMSYDQLLLKLHKAVGELAL